MKRKIVISEFMNAPAVDSLRRDFTVIYEPGLVDQRPALLGQLADADALIVRNRTQVNAELLAAAPALRVVGRLGVGLDNIELEACQRRQIEVIPATGANARAVAEYVIATAMLLLRGAYQDNQRMLAGQWPRTALSNGREIAGKVMGIVGFGGIGQLTASLAKPLGMDVIGFDPMLGADAPRWSATGVRRVSLDELIAQSDVITLHVPLTETTRHLIDATRLATVRPGAIVINTARGGVIDEVALVASLKSGHIGGAALDVFADEPLKADSPFEGVPNVILTPHIAGLTRESNARVSSMVAERVAVAVAR